MKMLMKIRKHIFSARTLFLVLALVPVAALVAITISLVAGSATAIQTLGGRLFTNLFVPGPETIPVNPATLYYGLLPALWGTFLVVLISVAVAFPISLAFAILANDFSSGFSRNLIRPTLGFLSGIPPVIIAMMSSSFFLWFLWPKFAGKDLPLDQLPPPNMLPGDASCTLLGGLMLALLLVPFMMPLLDDVFQNVPSKLKEASASLGANRWYTLKAVTLPVAFPGIVNVLVLGMLIALGDAIIVAYAIGFGARTLPSPLFDLLERTAPLTSTVAGLAAGGLTRAHGVGPVGESVASFIGLILLIAAFAAIGFSMYWQRKWLNRSARTVLVEV